MYFTKCLHLKSHRLSFILANYPLFLLGTDQEDRQLELVVKHHGVNAAGSAEPGCDFIQKVSVKDEEEDAWAWSRRGVGRGEGRDIDIMGKGETQWKVLSGKPSNVIWVLWLPNHKVKKLMDHWRHNQLTKDKPKPQKHTSVGRKLQCVL